MGNLDSIRIVVVRADDDTPALLRTLLRGRIDQSFSVEVRDSAPAPDEPSHCDVLILERTVDHQDGERALLAHCRAVMEHAGTPPLVLLNGTRSRPLEHALLEHGAADVLWKEELSAPLLESQIRHALSVRRYAALQRQFLEAQKLETIGRLAGGVAHDFNNILTAIVGFGGLVAEHVKGNSTAEAHLAEILQAAERASVLTRQLLAFGRRQVLHPVRLKLEETVDGITSLICRLIGDGIDLRITCAADLPPVRGDRAQIETAILHLVMFARDAMPRGGRLSIELTAVSLDEPYCSTHVDVQPGRYVTLALSDTGGGIAREVQERLFEPFYRSSESDDPARVLGLAAVYGVMKQSGGHILVYSEPGAGTTFRLYLPVDASAGEPAAESRPLRQTSVDAGTILLVEDAAGIRRLAGEVIRRAGYRVLEAGDPIEAFDVAAAHEGRIDLLLTDIMMPGGNGVDLAGQLTAARPRLNVLFMSGYTGDAVIRSGILAGDAPFLQKPFTPRELLHKVREILQLGA